jgi:hypothetical protein
MQCIQAGLASNLVKSSCMTNKKDIFVNTKKGIKMPNFMLIENSVKKWK